MWSLAAGSVPSVNCPWYRGPHPRPMGTQPGRKSLRGPKFLQKSIIYFASLFKDVRQINAEIKTNNVASRKAFEGVGFDLVKVDDEVGFFKFEL